MIEKARELDAADPLASYRDRFQLPDGIIYLDGNSLGALPKATPAAMRRVVEQEWGEGLIGSWNSAGWFEMGARVGAKIAPLIGAKANEVIACDTVSVNLFKLISAALQMRPGRKTILSEPGNFPTDIYMIDGLERQGLAKRRLVNRADLAGALDDDVALLLLTHAHYKSGHLFDIGAMTKLAHEAGALVLWDLSHSTGALPIDLNACEADFATGCGYKYLCGGPGAPAFVYVAQRHQADLMQPLTGWFGHAKPFEFSDDYEPARGIEQMQCGTSPILGLTALEVGVELIAEMGVARLHKKSQALSKFFLDCLEEQVMSKIELISQRNINFRGSQLSFRHPNAFALCQAIIREGVVGDFRHPDVIRLGFAPAYLSFEDIANAAKTLSVVLGDPALPVMKNLDRPAVT